MKAAASPYNICQFAIDRSIWFFSFEILKEVFNRTDHNDYCQGDKDCGDARRDTDLRNHLHDANNEKVDIGNFRELSDEVLGHESEQRIFGCLDAIVANLHIGDIGDERPIGHFGMRRVVFKDPAFLRIGVFVLMAHYNKNEQPKKTLMTLRMSWWMKTKDKIDGK